MGAICALLLACDLYCVLVIRAGVGEVVQYTNDTGIGLTLLHGHCHWATTLRIPAGVPQRRPGRPLTVGPLAGAPIRHHWSHGVNTGLVYRKFVMGLSCLNGGPRPTASLAPPPPRRLDNLNDRHRRVTFHDKLLSGF